MPWLRENRAMQDDKLDKLQDCTQERFELSVKALTGMLTMMPEEPSNETLLLTENSVRQLLLDIINIARAQAISDLHAQLMAAAKAEMKVTH